MIAVVDSHSSPDYRDTISAVRPSVLGAATRSRENRDIWPDRGGSGARLAFFRLEHDPSADTGCVRSGYGWPVTQHRHPLEGFSERTRRWFEASFEAPTPAQAAGLADDRLGRQHADLRADRLGQDAERLPLGDRLARPPPRGARHRAQDRLRLAAEGALLRRRAQPARAAEGDRRRGLGRAADRRHAAEGAPGDEADAAGHPDHDAGVAVPDDHLAGAGDPHRGRGGDRRRDPRRRPVQARLPPGADPRAALAPGHRRRATPSRSGSASRRPSGRWSGSPSSWSARSASARSSTPGSARTSTSRSSSRSTT